VSIRGPAIPAQEESQIWTETYNILKQLPEAHRKAQIIATEANKTQRILLALANGEGNVHLQWSAVGVNFRSECRIIREVRGDLSRGREDCRTRSKVRSPPLFSWMLV
jgi:hypothetical protein